MYPPKVFTPKPFIEAAEVLLACDETLMALDLLDKLPKYFQDHPPKEILALKREIMAKVATATFYAHHEGCELDFSDDQCMSYAGTLRNQLIAQDVKVLNEAGHHPRIFDHGPGEAALPLILKKKGLKFTYTQIYLNEPTRKATHKRFADVEHKESVCADWTTPIHQTPPIIWVSTEIIEHLHCESEIRFEIEQRCSPDLIHISTPLYTFACNVTDWRSIGWLGHLRTYSPQSFQDVIKKMFPEYAYAYYHSQVQHIRLINPETKFDCIKTHYEIKDPI